MIKASSILETVLSVTIIAITIAIAALIFSKIINSQNQLDILDLEQHIYELKSLSVEKNLFKNTVIQYKGYKIEKVVQKIDKPSENNLSKLIFKAYKGSTKVREYNFLVHEQ